MSTATKLEYLNDTKQLLKENINNLGGNLTNEPFRQYASVLEGIYESLPKVSGIGASLSLSPSMVGKIKLNEIQGDTFQQTYSGKNMFGGFTFSRTDNGITFTYNKDGSIKANGTSSASASSLTSAVARNNNYLVTLETGTYTISGGNSNATVEVIKSDGSFISGVATSEISKTFTISSTTSAFIRLNVASGKTLNNVIVYQMLEHSSTATDYEPYVGGVPSPNPDYPQAIQSVTGLQNVNVCGKNLFTGSIVQGAIVADGTLENSSTSRIRFNDLIPIEAGTYKISYLPNSLQYYVHYYYPDKTHRTTSGSWRDMGTFDVSEGGYIAIMFRKSDNSSITPSAISNIKIFDTNTSNTYEVNLGKNLFDINGTFSTGLIKYNNGFQLIKNSTNRTTNYFPASPILAGTYTLSYDIVSSTLSSINKAYVQFFDKDNTKISDGTLSSNGSTTFTFTGDAVKIYFFISSNESADVQITLDNIQLEKGSTATSYAPYFTPIELNKMGDYEDSIKKSTGKNLLNIPDGSYSNNGVTAVVNNGKIILNGTASATSFIAIPFNYTLEANKTYTLSANNSDTIGTSTAYCAIRFMGNLDTEAKFNVVNSSKVINLTTSLSIINLTIRTQTGTTYNNFAIYPQLEQNNQASSYEPYGKVWYTTENNGIIESYNGETITTDYISTTGELTTGAKIVYKLTSPIYTTITNTTLIEQLETLSKAKSKNGTTNINVTSEDLSMILNVGVLKGDAE